MFNRVVADDPLDRKSLLSITLRVFLQHIPECWLANEIYKEGEERSIDGRWSDVCKKEIDEKLKIQDSELLDLIQIAKYD